MLIFQRKLEGRIKELLFKKRAILIFGPRQSGKTTLSKKLIEPFGADGAYFNCELVAVRNHFIPGKPELLKTLVGEKKIVVFDEAQTIQDVGIILKSFLDTYGDIQIIATGSSSFDLANKINEPLTGRAFEFILYPLSLSEIKHALPNMGRNDLDEYMRLGTYPAVVAENNRSVKEDLLKNLATNYLYKDIYTFESIKNPRIFEELIKLLALQIGSLVSTNELSQTLGVSRTTVDKYLRLLEQSYVIKVVRSFSRNPRTEIKKAFKVCFLDVGIRNAVIDNIALVEERDDRGALFENFFIAERLKEGSVETFPPRIMFWKNRYGAEIDCIEESAGEIRAYECKWNPEKHVSFVSFLKSYPDAQTAIVSPDNIMNVSKVQPR